MDTWAFSPILMINLACIELSGPMMACTSTFFIRSTAIVEKRRREKVNAQLNSD